MIRAHRDKPAGAIVAEVRDAIRAFTGEDRPRDDVTLVVCKGTDDAPDVASD